MRVYETVAGAGAKVQVAGAAGWSAGGTPAKGRGMTGDLVISWVVVIALAVAVAVILLVGAWAY